MMAVTSIGTLLSRFSTEFPAATCCYLLCCCSRETAVLVVAIEVSGAGAMRAKRVQVHTGVKSVCKLSVDVSPRTQAKERSLKSVFFAAIRRCFVFGQWGKVITAAVSITLSPTMNA